MSVILYIIMQNIAHLTYTDLYGENFNHTIVDRELPSLLFCPLYMCFCIFDITQQLLHEVYRVSQKSFPVLNLNNSLNFWCRITADPFLESSKIQSIGHTKLFIIT